MTKTPSVSPAQPNGKEKRVLCAQGPVSRHRGVKQGVSSSWVELKFRLKDEKRGGV